MSSLFLRSMYISVYIFAMYFVGTASLSAEASRIRYEYVALDQTMLPSAYTDFYLAAIRRGRVYGTLCDATCSATAFGVFDNDRWTVLHPTPAGSFLFDINALGVMGGSVPDATTGAFRAALFFPDGRVEVIPPQPNETFAYVVNLNDLGVALVQSFDDTGAQTNVVYAHGKSTVVDLGSTIPNPVFWTLTGWGRWLNNAGFIAGTTGVGLFDDARGFRFDLKRRTGEVLKPYSGDPTETLAWGLGINNRGHVLGYSFVGGSPYHERVGFWDHRGVFQTYFVETISSNQLLFNNNDEIVITFAAEGKSYLVPRPNQRYDLTTLVANLPAGEGLREVDAIDDEGNLIGVGSSGARYLLRRIPFDKICKTPMLTARRHPIPLALSAFQQRVRPRLLLLK